MEAESFTVNEFKWWHFDHSDWASYPILNRRFDELVKSGLAPLSRVDHDRNVGSRLLKRRRRSRLMNEFVRRGFQGSDSFASPA